MSSQAPRMLWRRLPVYFPNIKLVMDRPDRETMKLARKRGWLEKASFRTTPEVTKLEVREFLEKVYGTPVVRVDTAIVQGAVRKWYDRKGGLKPVTVKLSDYKKVWVTFAEGSIEAKEAVKTRLSPKDAPPTLSMMG